MFECLCVCVSSELSKWLEPVEKLRFEIGSIPTLIDYIKQVQSCHSLNTLQGKVNEMFSGL